MVKLKDDLHTADKVAIILLLQMVFKICHYLYHHFYLGVILFRPYSYFFFNSVFDNNLMGVLKYGNYSK